jgi:hypothetical protein
VGNDAVNKQPTLDEQISAFKGFSAVDGVVQPEGTKTNQPAKADDADDTPRDKPLTAAEKLAQLSSGGRKAKQSEPEHDDEDEDENDDPSAKDAGADEDEDVDERQPRRDDRRAQSNRKGADKRIAQAVGRQRQAERERDAATSRVTSLEARLARLEAGGLTPPARGGNNSQNSGETQPDPADYQYGELDTRYISDLSRYETLKTLREEDTRRARAQQETQNNESRQAMAAKFREFETEGLARYDDFDVVVTQSANNGDWPLTPLLASLIIDSEHGPDIAYHLASDRKEAKRVAALTPAKQAAWFGQREAVLSAETPAAGNPALRVSRAPEAVRRQSRGSGSRQPPSADTTDFAAFERMATAKG